MDTMNTQRFLIDEDGEVLEQFGDNFESVIFKAESIALILENSSNDSKAIRAMIILFKELYSLAFNANIIPLIEPLTTLEDFLTRFENDYPHDFSYPLTLLLDRFLLVSREATEQYSVSAALISDIQRAIKPLARASSAEDASECVKQVVQYLLGDYSDNDSDTTDIDLFDEMELFGDEEVELFDNNNLEEPNTNTQPPPVVSDEEKKKKASEKKQVDAIRIEMDILMKPSIFRIFSEMIDARHKDWVGRSFFLMSLAIKMNAEARNVVDPQQLANAIYIHDFAMLKMQDELLYKSSLSEKEFEMVKMHPVLAYEATCLLGDYKDCAEMVHQHHERPDGTGYPNQLKGDEICHGAKIIAICDAYFTMTNIKTYRSNLRSPLRAVAEINACAGTQFDTAWVKIFNRIVKRYEIIQNVL